MNKRGRVVRLGIVTLFLSGTIMGFSSAANAQPPTKAVDWNAFVRATLALNRDTPTMIDEHTMLTRVEASAAVPSTTHYLKMINLAGEHLDQTFLANAQQELGEKNCLDTDAKMLMDQGLIMKFVVSGADNRRAGSFIISSVYCQKYR